jgi:integrase
MRARAGMQRLRRRSNRGLSAVCGPEGVEVPAFLGRLRTWRIKAIAGLMLFAGLRSAGVLALNVADVDIARGWAGLA